MMNKNILLTCATIFLFSYGAISADCCSHAVINNSGKDIEEVRFAHHDKLLNKWNVYATIKDLPAKGSERIKKFDTKQSVKKIMGDPYVGTINVIVIEHGTTKTIKGEWTGEKIFVITPDFDITTL